MKTKFIPLLAVITSAVFWGFTGIFTQELKKFGFNSSQSSALRMISAALFIAIFVLIKDKKLFKIKLKELPIVMAIGIISQFATSCLYFNAITASSLSTAAILMYTAPFIVMIASAVLYKEKLTFKKIIALIIAFIGCVFVSGTGAVSMLGIIFGLGSGITYASYSIFCKYALKKTNHLTVTLYGFLFAALASLFSLNISATVNIITDYKIILIILALGLVSATIPYLLYSYGLKYIEAGNAAIIAMLEPIVATLCGIFIYEQVPPPLSALGIVLIILAIIIIELKVKKREMSKTI